jgi:hypothetical protein
MKKSAIALAFLLAAGWTAAPAPACTNGPVTPWTVGSGGNGHSYQVVCAPTPEVGTDGTDGGIDWVTSRTAALHAGGYLATLTSAAENTFVAGLTDNADYWYVNAFNANIGPYIGLSRPLPCGSAPFVWVTGEAVSFTSWSGGEPSCGGGLEHVAHFYTCCSGPVRGSAWNDVRDDVRVNAYVVEYDEYPPVRDRLYVTNRDAGSVTAYPRDAVGNAAPLRTIVGASTGMNWPHGIAVDTVHGEIFVANFNANTVTVYDLAARDDAAPIRTLGGSSTLLDYPQGVAVDTVHDELVVVSRSNYGTSTNASVATFHRTDSGDVAPTRRIAGAATGLNYTHGVVIDLANDELLVANAANLGSPSGPASVTVYNRTDDGNATPKRTLSGGSTGLNGPIGIALDRAHGQIAVSSSGGSITVYPRDANGDTAPLQTISGGSTGLSNNAGIVDDVTSGELLVCDPASTSVTVYNRMDTGDIAPKRTLNGASTGLNVPAYLAVVSLGVRGDANGDGLVNVADVFYLINFLFAGGPTPLSQIGGDANADGPWSVADVFYLISYLFAGGPVPPL